jgi:predicted PurR-regulated permease PerM
MKKEEFIEIRKYIILVLTGVLSYWLLNNLKIFYDLFKTLFNVILPFILGGAIAFILNIPMSKIEKVFEKKLGLKGNYVRGISIAISILIVVFIILFICLLLVPELIENIKTLIGSIPTIIDKVKVLTADMLVKYPEAQAKVNEAFSVSSVSAIFSAILNGIMNGSVTFITNFISKFMTIFTGIIFSIYMLCQKEQLIKGAKRILYATFDDKDADKIVSVGKLTHKTFSKFLSGQCIDASILGLIMFIVLLILKFPYALLISVLTAVTALIPVFGAIVAMVVGAILIAITSPIQALMFILVFQIVQQIDNNFIYPRVVGSSVGLSPIWTLFAISVGGSLFGAIGMLVGLPLASVIYSLFKDEITTKINKKTEEKQKIKQEA